MPSKINPYEHALASYQEGRRPSAKLRQPNKTAVRHQEWLQSFDATIFPGIDEIVSQQVPLELGDNSFFYGSFDLSAGLDRYYDELSLIYTPFWGALIAKYAQNQNVLAYLASVERESSPKNDKHQVINQMRLLQEKLLERHPDNMSVLVDVKDLPLPFSTLASLIREVAQSDTDIRQIIQMLEKYSWVFAAGAPAVLSETDEENENPFKSSAAAVSQLRGVADRIGGLFSNSYQPNRRVYIERDMRNSMNSLKDYLHIKS